MILSKYSIAIVRIIFSLFFIGILCGEISAQVSGKRPWQDESAKDSIVQITIIRADEASGQLDSKKLLGDVILRQDSVLIFCDSATIVNNQVQADGNVVLEQYDSIQIFSDRAFYDGNTEEGFLYADTVILQSGDQQLFAKDSLNYDLKQQIAYYNSGALLIQDSTFIISQTGIYYLEQDEVLFKDEVIVKDSAFLLVADSLRYNTETKMVTFISPTRITSDSADIYCESGIYDLNNNRGYFSKNAQFQKGEQRSTADIIRFDQASGLINLDGNAKYFGDDQYAEAEQINYNTKTKDIELDGNAYFQNGEDEVRGDQVFYNDETKKYRTSGRATIHNPPAIIKAEYFEYDDISGLGTASGDVIWRDTSTNISIETESAEYAETDNYFLAYGDRPIFANDVEGDSLYLRADTLMNKQYISEDSDTVQLLKAYFDVRIFKSNFQGLCDSLVYDQTDSLFYLYDDPIVWSDTSQFVADTIKILMKNNAIDRIYLVNNAFIINSPDEILFNQVKGKLITAFFKDGELERMRVEGNAEAVYYALDEQSRYIGVNKTVASEMELYFENNEITFIKFLSPEANLLPIRTTKHEELKIKGFNWQISKRPQSVVDL
ncbi:MAG: hypothetical protein KJP00_10485 [Bacteroidia bacterium]|nr:hypothetical protein [Bacteroidia bacterium]